ncbi:DNA-binding protein [Candidatus Nitrotoga sp. HW29]|uniref:DNA-binding protein n=1 Tax=Candidatus Nitrotoga sp. HW29 TaxID=2886963 RepID=UPI001EF3AFC4|nr:DNA-binding protein [Candidatus Nitrotoga sp. HW29]
MESIANQSYALSATSATHNLPVFPPLEQVTRPTVPTNQAAYYLNRQPQTLRAWACLENGALRPHRICGRLAWKVSDIKLLLNGEAT